jgi:hypothetical protein
MERDQLFDEARRHSQASLGWTPDRNPVSAILFNNGYADNITTCEAFIVKREKQQ